MTPPRTCRCRAGFAGLALLVLAALTPGCGRPPDEAWLRFLGFTSSDSTTSATTSAATTLTVVEGVLRDGTTLSASANFENTSQIVGQDGGTGILVSRVRVDYRMSGYSPPSIEYGVNLYLSPPTKSESSTGSMSVALVPISLKQWLIDTGAFESKERKPSVDLTARLTFYGETDEGTQLEVEGSIAISLTNTGETSTPATTTVSIFRQANAVIDGADGGFVVYRTGSTASELAVGFSLSGSAKEDTDYYSFGDSVLIPKGSASGSIKVIAKSTATSGTTIIINLQSDTTYSVGSPSSATVQITN